MRAARPPPQKRRKLTPSESSGPSQDAFDVTPLKATPVALRKYTNLAESCVSCHRFLNAAQGNIIFCARCSSATCAVCSRTCTACVPSQPPTPHLTWSATPTPSPPPSPRRPALALNAANTNLGGSTHATSGKRKKSRDEDDKDIVDGPTSSDHGNEQEAGCGRIVCRNCSFENVQSALTTCYDCYGR